MSNKQQINLFKIAYEDIQDFLLREEGLEKATPEDVIKYIVSLGKGDRIAKELVFLRETISKFKPYKICGFYVNVPTDFVWGDFFENNLDSKNAVNTEFLSTKKTRHKSFFIFIYNKKSIYCFSGGLGYNYIKNFIEDDFGISILQKMNAGEDVHFLMLKSRSIVGNIAVDQRVFRDVHKTTDENTLGKVYRDVVAKIQYDPSLKPLKKIIFDDKLSGAKNISAGQSFKFSKSITLDDVKDIIDFFEKRKSNKSKFILTSFKVIKKDKTYLKKLNENLDNALLSVFYDAIKKVLNGESIASLLMYEVSLSDFMRFYESEKVVVGRLGRQDCHVYESPYGISAKDIIEKLVLSDREYINKKIKKIESSKNTDVEKLKKDFINSYTIRCFSEDGDALCSGKVIQSVTCEILYNNKKYFYLDSKWHKSEEDFLSKLNNEFRHIYKSNKCDYKVLGWKKEENENTYLARVAELKKINILVFHRVIAEPKMELCDVMSWNAKEVSFLYIKPSFDGNVRVLIHQIVQSSKLIEEDIRKGFKKNGHFHKFFNKAKNYSGSSEYLLKLKQNLSKMTYEQFVKCIQNKRINYVACVLCNEGESLSQEKKLRSNIAKLSLIEGYRTIRTTAGPNSNFLISQIKRAK